MSRLSSTDRRRYRVRKAVKSAGHLRLSVHRSLGHIYAQIIDDAKGETLATASSLSLKLIGKKTEVAKKVGQAIADAAKAKGVAEVVFDRGSFKYHGRVKALADGAREGGLKF